MGVELFRISSSPDFRSQTLRLLLFQAFLLLLFILSQVLLLSVSSGIIERDYYGIARRISDPVAGSRELSDLALIIKEGPEPGDIEEGETLLRRYGYSLETAAGLMRTKRYSVLIRITSGSSLIFLLFLFIGNFLLFLSFQKEHYRRLLSLTRNMAGGQDGIPLPAGEQYREGPWSQLVCTYRRLLERISSRDRRLRKDRDFLKSILSDVSHQLKTPLASLTMFTDLMTMEPEMAPEKRGEFLEQCSGQLERMTWLVKGLLKIARLEIDSIVYRKDPVSLPEIIRSILRRIETEAENRRLTVSVPDGGVPDLPGDADWLTEAFENIIRNAVAYTEAEGSVEISFKVSPLFIRVYIRDDGPGIPEEDLPRIFERFYKGGSSVSMDHVGIGLSLSRMIIAGHGGEIRGGNRKAGTGAEFVITFPLSAGPAVTPSE